MRVRDPLAVGPNTGKGARLPTILAVGAGQALLEKAALPLDADDAALIVVPVGKIGPGTKAFLAALAKHRNWDRAMDPPPV